MSRRDGRAVEPGGLAPEAPPQAGAGSAAGPPTTAIGVDGEGKINCARGMREALPADRSMVGVGTLLGPAPVSLLARDGAPVSQSLVAGLAALPDGCCRLAFKAPDSSDVAAGVRVAAAAAASACWMSSSETGAGFAMTSAAADAVAQEWVRLGATAGVAGAGGGACAASRPPERNMDKPPLRCCGLPADVGAYTRGTHPAVEMTGRVDGMSLNTEAHSVAAFLADAGGTLDGRLSSAGRRSAAGCGAGSIMGLDSTLPAAPDGSKPRVECAGDTALLPCLCMPPRPPAREPVSGVAANPASVAGGDCDAGLDPARLIADAEAPPEPVPTLTARGCDRLWPAGPEPGALLALPPTPGPCCSASASTGGVPVHQSATEAGFPLPTAGATPTLTAAELAWRSSIRCTDGAGRPAVSAASAASSIALCATFAACDDDRSTRPMF